MGLAWRIDAFAWVILASDRGENDHASLPLDIFNIFQGVAIFVWIIPRSDFKV